MFERHVTFTIREGRESEFERLFVEEYSPAIARQTGVSCVELLREVAPPHRYQIVNRFESEEAAAAWRASDAHNALSPRLRALYLSYELSIFTIVASQAG